MRLRPSHLSVGLAALQSLTVMAQPLLGLSLAPRLITVAEIRENQPSESIVQVEGNVAYQKALAEIARGQPPERHTILKALSESLKSVQLATNTHFNRRVQIPVVALPLQVTDVTTKNTIKDALIDIGFATQGELQHIEMPFAVHYAYDLGTAAGVGLEKGEVDWDMGVYEAVLVDYNRDILSISLLDLAEHGTVIRGQSSVPDLGEAMAADTAGQRPSVSGSQTRAHYISIKQWLETLLAQNTLLQDSASNTGEQWKPLRTDIRAVILTGDASTEGFEHLRAMLRDVFSALPAKGWLKDSIDPKNVAAVGAAKRAYHLTSRPEDFHVHVQHVEHSHDEL